MILNQKKKIKTSFAQIIVRKIKEKPYFEILYFDNQDKCFHIGFGSFYLEYVFQWLAEEFEIIEGASEIDYGRFQFAKEIDYTEEGETMDVREKLVELLVEFIEVDAWDNGEFIEKNIDFQKIASDLIAHGVTVQERGNWKYYHKQNKAVCTSCGFERDLDTNFGKAIACPNCGAYMPQLPKGE